MSWKYKWLGLLFIFAAVFVFILSRPTRKIDIRIPLISLDRNLSKCIEIYIEDEKYLFEIDTATPAELTLKPEILDKLRNKREVEPVEWVDINGNHYISHQYEIPALKIGKLSLTHVTVKEEKETFLLSGAALDPGKPIAIEWEHQVKQISGRIGSGFFRSWNCWLIDFPNETIYAIRDKKQIPSNWIRVALESIKPHFVILFNGQKFALDSDAEISFFRSENKETDTHVKDCILGGHNFGSLEFWPVNLPSEFTDFDGVLGIDFMNRHSFYLNTEDKYIAIFPSK